MNAQKLKLIDRQINTLGDVGELLLRRRGYYIYYNEPTTKTRRITIHKHDCGQCAYGIGKHPKAKQGKNGVWIGPFSLKSEAKEHIKKFGLSDLEVKPCTCIK